MEIRVFDELDDPRDNYAIYIRKGRYELCIGRERRVYIFDSFSECIEYIKNNYSKSIADSLRRKEEQLIEGVGIDVSEVETHANQTKIRKILKFLPPDAPKLFSKYSFFYGFDRLEESSHIDLTDKTYKVYYWYTEEGHKICNIGYTNGEIEFVCKKKFEYNILKEKYNIKYDIIIDSLPAIAAYLYSKCLVFEYENSGEYLLESTAYSYREYHKKNTKGIYVDKFTKRYFPEYLTTPVEFDNPTIGILDNISFYDEGVLHIDSWVTNHGGRVLKRPGKTTHCLIVKKSISYTDIIYYKKMGMNVCSSESVQKLIASVNEDVILGKNKCITVLPKFDVLHRDILRNTIAQYKDYYYRYMEYRRLCNYYNECKGNLNNNIEKVEFSEKAFNISDYPKPERDIFFDIAHMIEGYPTDEIRTKRRLARNYHKIGLFDEEIEILNGVPELEEMLALAIRCKNIEHQGLR